MDPKMQKILTVLKLVAMTLVVTSGSLLAAESQGVVLPSWLKTVCLALVSVGAALGITSKGLPAAQAEEPKP